MNIFTPEIGIFLREPNSKNAHENISTCFVVFFVPDEIIGSVRQREPVGTKPGWKNGEAGLVFEEMGKKLFRV